MCCLLLIIMLPRKILPVSDFSVDTVIFEAWLELKCAIRYVYKILNFVCNKYFLHPFILKNYIL